MPDEPVIRAASANEPSSRSGRPVQSDRRPHLLVADDERPLREISRIVLEDMGYRVTLAEDGVVAMNRLGDPTQRFDAMLLDMTMPRMGGLDAIRHARVIDPQIPILVMSGSADGALMDAAIEAGADALLIKPFPIESLGAEVGRLLASGPRMEDD